MDLFVVPTISFRLLYGLLIMGHGRRHILWFGVIVHPSAELSLEKDAPVSRIIERTGHILCRPILGGLHHQYARI